MKQTRVLAFSSHAYEIRRDSTRDDHPESSSRGKIELAHHCKRRGGGRGGYASLLLYVAPGLTKVREGAG